MTLYEFDLNVIQPVLKNLNFDFPYHTDFNSWVSQKDWLCYAHPSIKSLKDSKNSKVLTPNFYTYFKNNQTIHMGISYPLQNAVNNFIQLKHFPNRLQRDKILKILSTISDNWNFTIYLKTKWNTFGSSSEYAVLNGGKIQCNQIKEPDLLNLIEKIITTNKSALKKGFIHPTGKILADQRISFDFMEIDVSLNDIEVVKKILSEAFVILFQLFDIKNPQTILKEKKQAYSLIENQVYSILISKADLLKPILIERKTIIKRILDKNFNTLQEQLNTIKSTSPEDVEKIIEINDGIKILAVIINNYFLQTPENINDQELINNFKAGKYD